MRWVDSGGLVLRALSLGSSTRSRPPLASCTARLREARGSHEEVENAYGVKLRTRAIGAAEPQSLFPSPAGKCADVAFQECFLETNVPMPASCKTHRVCDQSPRTFAEPPAGEASGLPRQT